MLAATSTVPELSSLNLRVQGEALIHLARRVPRRFILVESRIVGRRAVIRANNKALWLPVSRKGTLILPTVEPNL